MLETVFDIEELAAFPATIEEAEDGFTITFRDVPEVISSAFTRDEAYHNATEALELALEYRLDQGEAIPFPSKPENSEVVVFPSASLQAAVLFRHLRADTSISDIARAMGTSWPAVQRLEKGKNAPNLKTLERAMAAVGKRLVLAVK
jgi:antitoxin HicB